MRKNLIFPVCITGLSIYLITCYNKRGHYWGDDFALYISQAKAICTKTVEQTAANNKFTIDNSTLKFFSPIFAPWGMQYYYPNILLLRYQY